MRKLLSKYTTAYMCICTHTHTCVHMCIQDTCVCVWCLWKRVWVCGFCNMATAERAACLPEGKWPPRALSSSERENLCSVDREMIKDFWFSESACLLPGTEVLRLKSGYSWQLSCEWKWDMLYSACRKWEVWVQEPPDPRHVCIPAWHGAEQWLMKGLVCHDCCPWAMWGASLKSETPR